jgi:hypothetical protein
MISSSAARIVVQIATARLAPEAAAKSTKLFISGS